MLKQGIHLKLMVGADAVKVNGSCNEDNSGEVTTTIKISCLDDDFINATRYGVNQCDLYIRW
jgi:hypothetical protein